MAGRRSKVEGVPALKRTLRRLPDTSRDNLAEALRDAGRRLLTRARADAPSRTGALRNALNFKVAAKTLQLTIGLVTKATKRLFFYGYILEVGRRAQTVRIKRGPRAGASMRIRAIAKGRYDFVFNRRKDFIVNEVPRLRDALSDALEDAARG